MKETHLRCLCIAELNASLFPGLQILPVSSSSQMVTFTFTNNVTITLRTSGTEPKIKYYSEIRGTGYAVRCSSSATLMAVLHFADCAVNIAMLHCYDNKHDKVC